MDYRMQDHKRQQDEALRAFIGGCKRIFSVNVGFRRGGLGDLIQAMSQHVSLSFLPTVDFLKQHSEALRAEGIEIVFHDNEGRDLELIRPLRVKT